jgi:hypothetical protein
VTPTRAGRLAAPGSARTRSKEGGPVSQVEAPRPATPRRSAWAPPADRFFRLLWIAQFASNLGTWMQTVGEQWLLVGHGALGVTLVQVAAGAPILLLALPAGSWRIWPIAAGC